MYLFPKIIYMEHLEFLLLQKIRNSYCNFKSIFGESFIYLLLTKPYIPCLYSIAHNQTFYESYTKSLTYNFYHYIMHLCNRSLLEFGNLVICIIICPYVRSTTDGHSIIVNYTLSTPNKSLYHIITIY